MMPKSDIEMVPPSIPVLAPRGCAVAEGLRSLDDVDLASVFLRRALVMRSVPHILQGPYTAAMRPALQEASQAQAGQRPGEIDKERGSCSCCFLACFCFCGDF